VANDYVRENPTKIKRLGTSARIVPRGARMRILLILLASLLFVAGTDAASTNLSKSRPLVGFEKGRMSARAMDVPLEDLLSENEEKSGIVIVR
jgi:hypothetical protein